MKRANNNIALFLVINIFSLYCLGACAPSPAANALATAVAGGPPYPVQLKSTQIPLQGVANASIRDYFPDFEYNGVTEFNSVEFDIGQGSRVSTYCSNFPSHFPEKIVLGELNIVNPVQLYVLINAVATNTVNSGDRIGSLTLEFEDDSSYTEDLIVGGNIREWRIDALDTIDIATSLSSSQVYSGTSDKGDTGIIDMLTVLVPEAFRRKTLSTLIVEDTSRIDQGSPNPCIFLLGVTVQHRP